MPNETIVLQRNSETGQVEQIAGPTIDLSTMSLMQESKSELLSELSEADRRYLELAGDETDIVKIWTVEVDGQAPWYIRRMTSEGFLKVGQVMNQLAPKLAREKPDIYTPNALSGMLAGLLFAAVVRGPHDATPFFQTPEEAVRQACATAPKLTHANLSLFEAIVSHHPTLSEQFGVSMKAG